MPQSEILIIIPAFNEAQSLPAVFHDLDQHCPNYDRVVVNDASTDSTADIAHAFGVPVLNLPMNLGIGGAVQTGFLWAKRKGYSIAIQFDGDGQHQARFIPQLVEPVIKKETDIAVGSRYMLQSPTFQTPWLRRSGMLLFEGWFKLLTGLRLRDTTSGFRACNLKAIDCFLKNYPVDFPEMPALLAAHRSGLRIVEVPVEMSQRQFGRSSIGFWKTFKAMAAGAAVLLQERKSYS